MLIRLSLIVAIIAGLATGALNFVMMKEKITTLKTNLQQQTERADKAESDLRTTRADLKKTGDELKQTKEVLASTTKERDEAKAEAEKRTKEAETLADDLKKTKTERDSAQEELAAFKATGMTPKQITEVRTVINNLQTLVDGTQKENKVLGKKIENLQAKLDHYENPDRPVFLPASLKGKILVADPKWNFVVLDVGENQGVREYGEMLVNRAGKLVAKVIIRNVQKDRSIANVLPGWQLGDVLEGDQVIPAHPASS